MKIKILKGTNQIGGCITEIESLKGTKILIDFGKDLNTKKNKIPAINWSEYKAVCITHSHEDHIGLINEIPDYVDVYIEEISLEIYKILLEFTKGSINRAIKTFKIGDSLNIEDISVESYIVDHSAFNSVMYLIKCDGKKLLHTGDFRDNGYKGGLLPSTVKKIKKVDIIIMEGTTLSRDTTKKNIKEFELYNHILETCREYKRVLILQSSTNIDRITTMYKAVRDSNKIFVEDVFTANITTLLASKGFNIPNPKTFEDVYSFTPANRSEYKKEEKSEFYNKHIEPFKDKEAHNLLMHKPYGLLIKSSMTLDLEIYSNKNRLKDTCLIYSMWDGYKEDLGNFFSKIENMGIKVITHHTSGHSDEYARDIILNGIEYNYLIPIHTTEKQKFDKYEKSFILEDNEILEVK